jgi:hypothetical protein
MSERVLGVALIHHRNGTVEKMEYVAHGATPIGWTFQVSEGGLVVIHPSSVTKMEIVRYKLDVKPSGIVT